MLAVAKMATRYEGAQCCKQGFVIPKADEI